MSDEQSDSNESGDESLDGGESHDSFRITQMINETESQPDERLSQDTYCSMNSQIQVERIANSFIISSTLAQAENSENVNPEDGMANTSGTPNILRGISSETTTDIADMCRLNKTDTSLEEDMVDKSTDNVTDISGIGNLSDISKETIDKCKDDSLIVCIISDTDKSCSLIEEDKHKIRTTPKNKTPIDSGVALVSPDLFSEAMCAPEPMDVSDIVVTPKNCTVLTIPDTSTSSPKTEVGVNKRKAESSSKDETPPKKARPSCMVIFEGTPQRKEPVPMFDLTERSPPEEITILDDTQNDFSLRLDSQMDTSSTEEKEVVSQGSTNTWKSHKTTSENGNISERNSSWLLNVDKENDLSWHSHKEDYDSLKEKYDEVVKEKAEIQAKLDKLLEKDTQVVSPNANIPDTGSSKESLYTYLEKCLLCGVVLFTVNEATNQIISANIKQVSLLGHPGKDNKQRSSLSSGGLADKSFSSGTSGESRVSMPGPFTLPNNRCSILSTASSSSSATSVLSSASAYSKVAGRNFDGPFLVPSVPVLKNIKDPMSHQLSINGRPIPGVDNLDEFLLCFNMVNGSPEQHMAPVEDKIIKCEPLKNAKNKDIKTIKVQETLLEEKEEAEAEVEKKPEAVAEAVALTPRKRGRGRAKQNKSLILTKSKVSTPVKKAKTSLSEAYTVVEEEIPVKPVGKAVFAKWSDSQYYSGWVDEDMNSSRVKVHFCDGNVNVLSSVKVIPADWLKAGRIALAQQRDNNEFSPCLVMSVELGGKDGPVFVIDGDSSSNKLNFSRIALTEAQVAEIREEAIATGRMSSHHLVSLDNVLNHPRTRTSRTPGQNTTPTRTPKGTPKTAKKKTFKEPEPSTSKGIATSAETQLDVAVDTDSSTVSSVVSENIRGFESSYLDPECSPQEFPLDSKRKTSHKKQVKSSVKKSKRALEEDFNLDHVNGPLPNEGSEIFSGYNFLLTYTSQKKKYSKDNDSSKNDALSSENQSTDDQCTLKPFNKQRLRDQIKKGGGKLYRTLKQVPVSEYSRTYLITDAPSCTPLYLQCLVHGIDICSHLAVIQSCEENLPFKERLKKDFILPAGWSLESTVFKNQKKNIQPFKNLKDGVLLALNENKASIQFWKKLVQAAGAKVHVLDDRVTNLDKISVIIADGGCSDDLIDEAAKSNVPVVSLVWLEQSIINGNARPFAGHSSYKYNHIIEPASPEY